MKRLLIIVDSLRRDAFEWLIWPHLAGYYAPVQALSNWTLPVLEYVNECLRRLPEPKLVLTSGYGLCVDWAAEMHEVEYPLLHPERWPELPTQGVLVVHDYYVHDYFQDAELDPQRLTPPQTYKARIAYWGRVSVILGGLRRTLHRLHQWRALVVADHGEAFFEDGVHFHHGVWAASVPEVMRVPWFEPGQERRLKRPRDFGDVATWLGLNREACLRCWFAHRSGSTDISPATKERLRGLGYVQLGQD